MTVAEAQRALLARGYDVGPDGADGDPGPNTIGALMAFQRIAGLSVTGILDGDTTAALGGPLSPPQRADPGTPKWLALAKAELGVKEGPGAANNPRVVKLFADAGFPGVTQDSVAWCAAAVGAILARSGIKPSGSLAARSYETWGVGLKTPVLGCIGVKKRPGAAWQGHVGFVVGANARQVFMLGGNQADAWTIAAFNRAEFTAFRWPSSVPIPASTNLPTIAGAKSGVSEA